MNEADLKKDIDGVGGKVGELNTAFQVCQTAKGKDIEQLQDRCTVIEAEQKIMVGEIKEVVKSQNKIVGGLAIAVVILQIIMPIIMEKFLGK